LIKVIEEPEVSIDELMEIIPGPDFPTGGVICGRSGVHRGYHTGRSTIVVRAKTTIEEKSKGRTRILVHQIPYQVARDRVIERIGALVNEGRIKGITAVNDESDLKEPVRIVIDVKRGEDPEIILNQLYQFSQLQDSFSIILLALVDGKPRVMTLKAMLEEFIRHRLTVIRRRTMYLLSRARKRKHTVEGLLLALANIDEIIRIIRASATQVEAKQGLMGVECPAAMMQRALGDEGFEEFQRDRGVADVYRLTAVQSDAILRMTLGQLVNLEQERLADEHAKLLEEIREYLRILSDDANILAIVKEDLEEMERRYSDARRTEISHEELGNVDMADLITEETMVVTLSHRGYIKRTPSSVYRAQRRGGKGLRGATTGEEDPIEHLFVASTHDYLMFFTNRGQIYWRKVYELPQGSREGKGRSIANVLQLSEGEQVAACRSVHDFDVPDHYLVMATRKGLVKRTELKAYRRPMQRGIIAIKLRDDDELVSVQIAQSAHELVLSTTHGMAIRFRSTDCRSTGRNTSGVKGISLGKDDSVVGMVVADPGATLLTACEYGYGKRTYFGPNAEDISDDTATEDAATEDAVPDDAVPDDAATEDSAAESTDDNGDSSDEDLSSSARYRTQKRGGKGLRDIKTTKRNGPVIAIVRVTDDDQVFLMTSRGKLQRLAASEISVIGRNTQGVRIMGLSEGDTLAAVVRVPPEAEVEGDVVEAPVGGGPEVSEALPEASEGEESSAEESEES
jgi:DNA gyrase subunit A